MKRYLPVILLMLCSFASDNNFKTLHNLTGGTWSMKTVKGYMCERWVKTSEHELKGTGFKVSGEDTTTLEHVLLVESAKGIFYNPDVNGQNKGERVSFKLLSAKNNEFIFEDPKHNFPQRVIYHFIKPDSLHAWVDGNHKGQYSRQDFYYARVR